ncbi:TetR/AcrR family transcriptional regulator [Frankia sp. AiPs1]|uniref:TetR/AcrR family transcriptional regulator n=1 Tax=Frankia sp. AiPs1 TaxID=573493 RepID=UPI002043770C|nr:TetR/AcrR family transcriptional regulator [Frankia sp. AiPs1]MCM3921804.1 TetR/AcrR family transcriptional regulator [Frankia sp. AiPs1]
MTDGGTRGRPGRRRNELADQRILDAVLSVFTTDGWRGFSLDSVARVADIGKGTIYLRFPTREALIHSMIDKAGFTFDEDPAADLRSELHRLATAYARWLDGPHGPWGVRLFVESRLNPDFAAIARTHSIQSIKAAHQIVSRAKLRQQLPPNCSAAVVLDSVLGGVIHHPMSSPVPPGTLYRSPAGVQFLATLVDSAISGALARGTDRREHLPTPDGHHSRSPDEET